MFKLDLEKAEEPEIKLPTSAGSLKMQESSRKTSSSVLLTTPKPLSVWITTNCGKFFKRWNTRPPDLPPEKSVYSSGKEQLEPDMEQQTGSKSGKEYFKAVYCHPAYFYAEYIMRNAEWDEAQAGIKIAGRNINNLRYADDTTLNGRKRRRTKEPLDESEKGE